MAGYASESWIKDKFVKYVEVKKSRKYDMIHDIANVMPLIGLNPQNNVDISSYIDLMANFSLFYKKFFPNEKFSYFDEPKDICESTE